MYQTNFDHIDVLSLKEKHQTVIRNKKGQEENNNTRSEKKDKGDSCIFLKIKTARQSVTVNKIQANLT